MINKVLMVAKQYKKSQESEKKNEELTSN